jgi:hypothetical protein
LAARAGPSLRTPVYAVVIFAVGLVYRLTWIYQGFAATDEGWLQAQGARIAHGQVPYRDFDYVFTPLTSYKEAALAWILGDHWTVFASRTLFAVEVSVAPVLAFLILRRFVSDRAAFFATIPAIFFTVIILAFTSYTIDAELMALVAITFAVYAGDGPRRAAVMHAASGFFAVLALMSKQPFLAFLVAIPITALLSRLLRRGDEEPPAPVRSIQAGLGWYALGVVGAFALVIGYFAIAGGLGTFINEPFIITVQANPRSLQFRLIQDLPEYITRYNALVPGLLVAIFVSLGLRVLRPFEIARHLVLAGVLALVLYVTLRRPPPPSRPFFVIVAYGILVAVGLVALVTTAMVSRFWSRSNPVPAALRSRLVPPELVFLALFLQWEAQFHYDGLVFWYEGAYLSVPVVLLFVQAVAGAGWPLVRSRTAELRLATPTLAPAILGAWFVAGSVGVVAERPYEDAVRPQLTGSFSTPGLTGITTYPLTAARFDGLVQEVDHRTKPGDSIYVLPDFSLLYEVTGRHNPTRVDWPNESFLTTDLVRQMVDDLRRDPPRVVFIQTQREGTYLRNQAPIEWHATKWAPIYDYLTAHYTQVDSVQDISVMVPSSA